MKKGDVVQLSVIILALIMGFMSLQYAVSTIASLLYIFAERELDAMNFIPTIVLLLITLLQVAVCWLLISRSRNIADFVYERSNMGTSFKIISRPEDLLFVLIIITGFYFLLTNLPGLIQALIEGFKSKAAYKAFENLEGVKSTNWITIFINLLLPLVLLMFAKPIAIYFAKNVDAEPIVIEDDMDHIHSPELSEE